MGKALEIALEKKMRWKMNEKELAQEELAAKVVEKLTPLLTRMKSETVEEMKSALVSELSGLSLESPSAKGKDPEYLHGLCKDTECTDCRQLVNKIDSLVKSLCRSN